jgi:hypothetical protein
MDSERVLVVVTPTVGEASLREAVPPGEQRGKDLRVVVPAVANSALSYWFSDDRAMNKARTAAKTLGEAVSGEAATMRASAGDCDPALAVEDAIATFHPDRIIVVHRADQPGYREEKLDADSLSRRIDREVEDHLVPAG